MSNPQAKRELIPLNIAVLTISDSRTEENNSSGKLLAQRLTAAGHRAAAKPHRSR